MPSETTQSSGIISALYIYRLILKLTLKAKELNNICEKSSKASVIKSDLYEFKTVKDFTICLEIEKSDYDYNINIKGSEGWSFHLKYAYLVSKDCAFSLKKSKKLWFLDSFRAGYVPDEETVIIHSLVKASYANSISSSSDHRNDISEKEGQSVMDFKNVIDTTLPSDYKNEMVIDFFQKGVLPDLTVKKAIEIIDQTKIHKCEVLKILCLQYLMNNINSETLSQILRAAIDLGLPLLERNCVEQIANGKYSLTENYQESAVSKSKSCVMMMKESYSSEDSD